MMTPEQIRELVSSATWKCTGCDQHRSMKAIAHRVESRGKRAVTEYNFCRACWIAAFPNEK